jgi:ketosteroid isomerase-like protein
MSEENVEIVRRVYEGWARRDFSAGEYFDPEIDFELVDWPHPARSRGVAEMRRTWQTTLSAWDDFRAEPDEFVDYGNSVLVLNSIRGRGKGSGAEVSAQTATVWTLEAGKVVRLALHWDTAQARAAAERPA